MPEVPQCGKYSGVFAIHQENKKRFTWFTSLQPAIMKILLQSYAYHYNLR
jgi:hypothetical protein